MSFVNAEINVGTVGICIVTSPVCPFTEVTRSPGTSFIVIKPLSFYNSLVFVGIYNSDTICSILESTSLEL